VARTSVLPNVDLHDQTNHGAGDGFSCWYGGRRLGPGIRAAALAGLTLAAGPAAAQFTQTNTSSTTASEVVVGTTTTTLATTATAVSGPSHLALPLTGLLTSLDGPGVLDGLRRVLGPAAVTQTTTSTTVRSTSSVAAGTVVGTYQTFGAAVIPVGSRPGAINCSGPPSPASGTGVWPVANCNFAGYQQFVVAAGTVNVNTNTRFGFDYRANSVAGGLHREDGPWRFGVAFSIGRVNIHQQVTGDSAGIDAVHLGLYGAWRGPVTVAAALSYGRHGIDTRRLTALPINANASYDAHAFGAGVEVSAPFAVFGGTVEPLAGLTYNALRGRRLHRGRHDGPRPRRPQPQRRRPARPCRRARLRRPSLRRPGGHARTQGAPRLRFSRRCAR
jgi:outer membrane autotransporter protein